MLNGPAISFGKQAQIPEICAVIDYALTKRDVRGWPFAVVESADDECGVYFPSRHKVFLAGFILNTAMVSAIVI